VVGDLSIYRSGLSRKGAKLAKSDPIPKHAKRRGVKRAKRVSPHGVSRFVWKDFFANFAPLREKNGLGRI
jgi:hypothetical protein